MSGSNPLPLVDERARPGIVFAFRFDAAGRGEALPLNRLPDFDDRGVAFWWVHVNLADKRGREWVSHLERVPEDARETLLSTETHDRIEIVGSSLAGVFVDFRLDFDSATEEMAQLRFLLADRLLLTGRRQSLRSIEATRAAVESGSSVESALELLEAIVDHEADTIARAVVELGHAVDGLEDRVLAGDTSDAADKVGGIRRRAVALNRQLARLLGLFRRVELAPAIRLPADVREAAGRMAQRLEWIYQDVHSSQERARLLQDEIAGRMTAETNRQLYVLSLLTAVFLPPTLVTGLFGMNTKGLPFADDERGFWFASLVALAAATSVFVGLRWSGRRRS